MPKIVGNADGYIIIDTKINTDGIEQGYEKIKEEAGDVAKEVEKVSEVVQSSFGKAFQYDTAEIEKFVNEYAEGMSKAEKHTSSMRQALEEAEKTVADLEARGFFWDDEEYVQAQQNLERIKRDIKDPQNYALNAQKIAEDKEKAAQRAKKAAEREAEAEKRSAQRAAAEKEKAARQAIRAAEKTAEAEKRAAEKAARAAERAEQQKQKPEEQRYKEATKGVRRFGSRFKEIVSGALVFNLISAGLRNVTQYFGKALNSNDEYKKSLASLKGALLTAFQPIYEVAVPAIITLLNIATKAAQAIGHIFASLAGKSDVQMAKNAKALYDQANAIDETGKSAKKAQRYLAGFDQIQKVSKNTSEEESATVPDFSAFESADYQSKIEGLVMLTSMALLSLGAILTFSGANIPLGIGMMALGAAGMVSAITENWGAAKEALQGPISDVLMLLGTALLVIGAILAFSGANIPLGIGLLVAGAATLAPTIAANWNFIGDKIKGLLASLLAIIAGATLVLGFLLCLTGVGFGTGLALILAGVAGTKAALSVSDNPITRFVKNLANGIIGIINKIIDAINEMFHIKFKGLNIGGVQLIPEINTKLINLPKIPMLAEGAVIPPNHKFLAMLGDQPHGTNIEAPLETIQEAVASVMADFHAGNMAGHEATVAVLKEILEAVLGIEIGDSVIGEAYERYRRKMAIAKGGA